MVIIEKKITFVTNTTQVNMHLFNLQLTKPLVFLKVHTTGINPNMDRIIQITITKYHIDGTFKTGTRLINPEMPISLEVSKINGITNEMVNGKPTFYQIAQGLHKFIGDSDIAGFNVDFDLRFLMEEFGKAMLDFNCVDRNVIDLKDIYHTLHPRDFHAASQQYTHVSLPSDVPIDSEVFTNTCVLMLNGMIEQYGTRTLNLPNGKQVNFGNTVHEITENFNSGSNSLDMKGYLVKDDSGNIILAYGKKYRDRPLLEIIQNDRGYLDWLINQSEVPRDTKNIISTFIKKVNTTPQTT